jgi:hypothetical protein
MTKPDEIAAKSRGRTCVSPKSGKVVSPSSTGTSVKYDVERVANYLVGTTTRALLTESRVAYHRGKTPARKPRP